MDNKIDAIYRGSEWGRWDLHIHSPYSYGGNYENFITSLEKSDVRVVGINDYCSISGYEKILDSGHIKRKILFPVIEFRMINIILDKDSIQQKKGARINFHIIFDNEIKLDFIKTWLNSLECLYEGGKKQKLGNIEDVLSERKKVSVDYFYVLSSLEQDENLKNHFLVWLPYDEYGGIDNIDPNTDQYFKQGLINRTHIIGSSNRKQIDFFLWKSDKYSEEQIKKWLNDREIPCIKGSDSHQDDYPFGKLKDEDSKPIDKYCWIKADPTFEGLKQIIYEPEERVYVGEKDPSKFVHQFFESFIVEDDASDQFFIRKSKKIYFNSGLTAVIGPRGAGKSVFLDSISLVSDKQKVNPDSYVSSFLIKDKKSSLDCSADVKGGSEGQVVNYKWTLLGKSQIERVNFDYFYQKEIGRLAEGRTPEAKRKLNGFIFEKTLGELATDTLEKVEHNKNDALANLVRNREDVKEQENLIISEQKIDQQLADLQKQLFIYSREDLRTFYERRERILRLQEKFKVKISALNRKLEELEIFLRKFNISELIDIKSLLDDYDEKDSEQVKEDFKKEITGVLGELNVNLKLPQEILKKLKQTLNSYEEKLKLNEKLSALQLELYKKFEEAGIQFNDDVQALIVDLQKNISELRAKKEGVEKAKQEKQKLLDIRRELIAKYWMSLNEAETALKNSFDSFCQQDGKILNQTIIIDFYRDVDSTIYIDIVDRNKKLREEEGGRRFPRAKLEEVFKGVKNIQEIIDAFRNKDYRSWSKIKGVGEETISYLEAIENAEEIAMLLEESLPSLRATIKWRDKKGNYKPLSECSVGERSTALLSIILTSGRTPLLIDQLEEDLDNFYISEQLIPIIKTVKKRRQLIFVTHNANIVVNGDAELILILKSQDGRHAQIEPASIENLSKREEIIEILEGGKDAFAKRELKLNPKGL